MIQATFSDIRYYGKEYVRVIFIMQIIMALFAFPLISFLMQQAFSVSGLEGVTHSNFMFLLNSPLGLVFLGITLFVTFNVIYIELVIYVFILHKHRMKEPFSWRDFFGFVRGRYGQIAGFSFALFFLYFLLTLPLGTISLSSGVISQIQIPNFISGELLKSTKGTALYVSVVAIAIYLNLRLIFTLYHTVADPSLSIFKAMKKSFKLTSRQVVKLGVTIFLFISFFGVIIFVGQAILLVPVYLADQFWLAGAPYIAGFSLTLFSTFLLVVVGIGKAGIANTVYYFYLKLQGERITNYKKEWPMKRRINKKIALGIGVYLIVLTFINSNFLKTVIYKSETNIIAHRGGYTKVAVENSIEAMEAAVPFEPDYIEIDVMETKDGKFIIFHDKNIRRLTGINREISDMTLAETRNLTLQVGELTAKIPTLEEFIDKAQDLDLKLLLEIKTHGKESPDMLNRFVDVLKDKGVDDEFLVQSIDLNIVEALKEKDENLQVGYVIPINIGNLVTTKAGFIVIEDFSLSQRIMDQADKRGVKVFVWTINNRNLMIQYMSQHVDGLITNELPMAKEVREQLREDNTVTGRLKVTINNKLN